METIKNKSINKSQQEIKIYDTFDEYLVKKWKELYLKGANFQLSYEWCSIWFKYFNKNRKLQIITIWDDGELKLLAPFYKEKDKLYLIGSVWDYFNEFDLLYANAKYVDNLLDYLIKNKIDVCFRYLNSETALSKIILQKYVQNGIKYLYQIRNTKPYVDMGNDFKPEIKSDIKKCRKKIKTLYGEELAFEYNLEKKEDFMNEFISMHRERWKGGIFNREENLDLFISEIYTKTNLTFLSRLYLDKSNKTVAYCFNYLDSNNRLWLYQPANNLEYTNIGPGKLMIQYLIENAFNMGIKKVDLGLGSQSYKYRFANKDTIVYDLTTFNNNKLGFKVKRVLDELVIKPLLENPFLRNFSVFFEEQIVNFQ